jgi:hypothetical protein
LNRQKLTELLQYPERISSRDTSMLTDMAEQYPYATVIQILLAKSKQQQADARQSLATAALYSPNRGVLRQVIENTLPQLFSSEDVNTADVVAASTPPPPAPEPEIEQDATVTQPKPHLSEENTAAENAAREKADVFEELQKNLRRLREERSKWHQSDKSQTANDQNSHNRGSAPEQNIQHSTGTVPGPVPATLQQIIEDHQEQPLENPRIQAQRSLIDSFLENGGNLQRRQLQQQQQPIEEVTDLSQNASYTPQDLATETLAKIMERQGKIEKALDIYQKLSLKYPQKSAYFANCIERLKKDL